MEESAQRTGTSTVKQIEIQGASHLLGVVCDLHRLRVASAPRAHLHDTLSGGIGAQIIGPLVLGNTIEARSARTWRAPRCATGVVSHVYIAKYIGTQCPLRGV